MMNFDLQRARKETPGCEHVLHFNNAGAALPPDPVIHAVISHLQREAEMGGYEAAEDADTRARELYVSAGRFLQCLPEEVAYCQSATHAWSLAFEGLYATGGLKPGQVILTSQSEYGSAILAFSRAARQRGIATEIVADADDGSLCLVDLERRLGPRVGLIALTHVPTNGGLVNPACAVGRLARQSHTPYFLDACQSAGQLSLNVSELGCDILTLTGRKYLRGPRGSGLLYVRKAFLDHIEPLIFDIRGITPPTAGKTKRGREGGQNDLSDYRLRPDAKRYELWESSMALRLGLAAALDYALSWDMKQIEQRIMGLAATLRDGLNGIDGLTIQDKGAQKCGIVGFTHENWPAHDLKASLRRQNTNISVSAPEMTWYDARKRHLPPLARASLHYYNSEAEIEHFVAGVGEIVAASP